MQKPLLIFILFIFAACGSKKAETEQKVLTDTEIDEVLKEYAVLEENQFIAGDTITGYFNHDRILDTAFVVPQQIGYEKGNCQWSIPVAFVNEKNIEGEEDTECRECTIRFSDPKIPSIRVIGISGNLYNVGDLNNNGTDELIFYPHWFQSTMYHYYVWTLSKNKWINAVEPIFIWIGNEDCVENMIKPHPTKKGYAIVKYSEMSSEDEGSTWQWKTKIEKVKR